MASQDQSVAPKERVNIVYKSATGDLQEETELPLKILMVGDYTGRPDDTPLDDFSPEGIVAQVPELKKLLDLRAALTALKGPLGNVPAFRKKIQALLGDAEGRQKLMKELGLGE